MKTIKLLALALFSIVCGSIFVLLCFSTLFLLAGKLNVNFSLGITLLTLVLSAIIPGFILFVLLSKLGFSDAIFYILFIISCLISCFVIYSSLQPRQRINLSSRVVADVRTYATALEVYHENKNNYPVNLEALKPEFIGELPSRLYVSRKICPQENAILNYTAISTSSFSLEFCLEEDSDGIVKGVHSLTQNGIN